jgi:hypothetical protein
MPLFTARCDDSSWGLAQPCIATAEAAPSLTSLVKDGHDAARSQVRGTWSSTASALQKSHGGQIRGAHPCKERKDGAASSCGHPWSRSARGGPAARINGDFRVCVRARSSLRDFISISIVDPAMNRWAKLGRPSDFVVRFGLCRAGWPSFALPQPWLPHPSRFRRVSTADDGIRGFSHAAHISSANLAPWG